MSRKLTKEEFIEKARKVHGNKYNYSKVKYKDSKTKVCIICPIHGEFWQTANSHIQGSGCRICGQNQEVKKHILTTEEFIKRANKIHNNKYDYSKTNYINNITEVSIICPIHGEFLQKAKNHIEGKGCKKCGYINNNKLTIRKFIEKAREIHGDKYNYSKVEYINNSTKVCIICPIHGEFWQTPNKHLSKHGCPQCVSSKLEEEIRLFLQENNIEFEEQKKFEWLGKQTLDLYLPKHNIVIECQGIQHFKAIDLFGGLNGLLQTKIRDERKRKLCEENGVKLLYYSNLHIDYPYEVFEDKEKLLEEIVKI